MNIGELLSYLNTTAMVLGYILLALLLAAVFWMAGNWTENVHYRRQRKRRHDREWDEIRAAWLDEMHDIRPGEVYDLSDRIETRPQSIIDSIDRLDTDVMDQTFDQIVNYQKEHNPHDAS